MRTTHATWALGLLLLLFLPLSGCGKGPSGAARLTDTDRSAEVASFDEVWRTIRDSHWDPELGGVDWDGARTELRPQVEAARTRAESRRVIRSLIERLGQSHFGIIPKDLYDEVGDDDALANAGDGQLGLDVRVLDGRAVVTSVRPGPAAEAGVSPGWEIRDIGGRSVPDILKRVARLATDERHVPYFETAALLSRMSGTVGSPLGVTFVDMAGDPHSLTLALAEPDGTPARIGHLPTFFVRIDTHALESGTGYIAFNAFLDPVRVMGAIGDAVDRFRDAPGIILDLRGNPGGLGAMAMGIAGWFIEEPNVWLGVMDTREMSLKFTVNPRAVTYGGPVAVLVDELSMSTSEILAGGLQDVGRAWVFGTPSPGAALPSTIVRLPNGDGFQFAFANYTSAGGEPLEGRGVTPDEIVRLDRDALAAGHDPVLDAAERWILRAD